MANLEDTVRTVVQDLISSEVLFTALDISNAVKQQLPNARHREVRDVVRGMFTSDIESAGWARTPITVTLGDGTTAEALLYHPLTDSWDLDNKYDVQQRTASSFRPVAVAQATLAAAQAQVTPPVPSSTATATTATPWTSPPAPVTVAPMPTARDQWNSLFQTQPSLFPKK
jgi:hypothetical protein